jgi:hypothetical protein
VGSKQFQRTSFEILVLVCLNRPLQVTWLRAFRNRIQSVLLSRHDTRVCPKVSGLAAWSENCKWCSSLLLNAVYRYFVNQSSEFCRHNPLCCSSRSVCCCCLFRYRLSPETFGYSVAFSVAQMKLAQCSPRQLLPSHSYPMIRAV